MNKIFVAAVLLGAGVAGAQTGGGFDLSWSTVDGGGAASAGGAFVVIGTIGQPDAGVMTGDSLRTVLGGFWAVTVPDPCYVNCDASTTAPILNVQDFTCFLNRFNTSDPYANCDGSTTPPVLNVQDFTCFINKFNIGCP